MPHAYLGLSSAKSALAIASSDTVDDARLRAVLEAVAEAIDDECQRTFRVYLATYYATAWRSDRLLLPFDLLSLTSLKTDSDGDRTYEDTWDIAGADTDVDLLPFNAAVARAPYWELAVSPNGDYSFPVGVAKGVEVVCKAGYREDLLTLTATVQGGGITSTATALTLSATTDALEVGQTLLIESEQAYITAISGTAVTLERAQNGTTGAAHAAGVAISLYRYPRPVVEASLIAASRLWRRKDAPFGVTGSAEMGTAQVIARIDPDVRQLIQRYRSGLGMVA